MKFDEFGLGDKLQEALSFMGFEEATQIQEHAIPKILENQDLLASAQTGTGKTAAFILPVIEMLSRKPSKHVRALVIAPTRELANQIEQQIQAFAYFVDISSIAIYGGGDGQEFIKEKRALINGTDIVVATPGKLISHLNMGYADFSKIEHLILDEADRMLDMGFLDDIKLIISKIPKKRQTLLFSATMPPKMRTLSKSILTNPAEIRFAVSKPAEGVLQVAYKVEDDKKSELIKSLIKEKPNYHSIIIFTSTKKKVFTIVRSLSREDYQTQAISSDLSQKERELALRKFKSRETRVLVATDVLSRGIDIKDINLVINYDVPRDAEDYVHRVGRTARADSTGVAITLIAKDEMYKFRRIEKLIGNEVMKIPLPNEMR
jgi:superfamily II DNA/RNA helicase